jgi:hypothetical protein
MARVGPDVAQQGLARLAAGLQLTVISRAGRPVDQVDGDRVRGQVLPGSVSTQWVPR